MRFLSAPGQNQKGKKRKKRGKALISLLPSFASSASDRPLSFRRGGIPFFEVCPNPTDRNFPFSWNFPALLIVKFSIPLTAFFPGSASASLFTRSSGDLPDLKSPGLRLRREIFPPPAHSAVSALSLTEIRIPPGKAPFPNCR